ncbi:MAG TPA: translocation/assembly module TamB domain-containing protein [Vicinamibacterales bacterium]|nr:translocation/assembly module TamB domain-containing protein [Vicinamibacterales bacterium]
MSLARRSLQVVAFVLTLLVGVAAMAVIVTQTTWFKDWLRGFIVKQAEDYVNGRLAIGRLDGNLFFNVEMEDVDVTMNGKTVVGVKDLGLDYNPLAFLHGEVILNHIRLDQPRLVLEQTSQGWNLANLIKAKTPKNPNGGTTVDIGEIGVSDGSVTVHPVGTSGVDIPNRVDRLDASIGVKSTPQRLVVDVTHVSLRASQPAIGVNALSGVITRSKDKIELRNVAIRTEQSSLTANGTITNLTGDNPVVNVKVTSDTLSVPEIARVVPALRGYDLQPAFEIDASGPARQMAVTVDARDARLGKVGGHLTVDAADPRKRVAGTVSLTHLDIAPLAAKNAGGSGTPAALTSDITGEGRIALALPSGNAPLSGTYAVNAGRVSIAGYDARNVEAQGRIDGQTLKVDAKAMAYGGNASAAGTVKIGTPLAVDLSGRAAHLDLRNLPKSLNAPGVPSNLAFAYTLTGRGSRFSGTVTTDRSMLAGATIASGTVAKFSVGGGAPSYAARGEVAHLDIQQVGQGFNIKALAADRFKSDVNASFDVSGSGGGKYPLTLDATGTLADSHMFGAAFPRMTVAANLAGGDAKVSATGSFENLDPAVASGNEKIKGDVSGNADLTATIRGYAAGVTADSIDAAGRVSLDPSTVADLKIESAVVDGRYANRAGVINQLSVTGPDVTLMGQGPVDLTDIGSSNLTVHLETPSLDRIGQIVGQPLTGGAVVDATVNGNGHELDVTGTLTGSNLGEGNNNALAMTSNFDVTVPALDAKQATVHANNNATFVQVGGQKINSLYADVTYYQQQLDFDAVATQEMRQLSTSGSVILHPDHQEIHLPDLALRSGQIEWRTPPGSQAAIQYGNNRIGLAQVELVNGNQRIVANGTLGAGAAGLHVQAQHVDVAQLDQLVLLQQPRFSGTLDADATVTGTTSAPTAKAMFTLSQGGFRQFHFDSFGGTVDYAPRGVDLDVKLQQNATQWVTAKGFAPMALFKAPAKGPNAPAAPPVDIQVASSPIDLGIVQGFTSAVSNVTGTLQANFKVAGSADDPHAEGTIAVHNGAFALPDLGTTYTGLDTQIDLTPDVVHVSEMHIVDNHGSDLTVGGQLAVHERAVGDVNISVKSNDFKVIDNQDGNLRLSTDVQVTGELRQPKIRGSVNVTTGMLDIAKILQQVTAKPYATEATKLPAEEPSAVEDVKRNAEIPAGASARQPGSGADTSPRTTQTAQAAAASTTKTVQTPNPQGTLFDNLDMNLRVGVPDDLVLKGQGIKAGSGSVSLGDMNITVGGNLRVRHMPGDIVRLRGDIETVRGSYTFQGRRFDISRNGKITFAGTDEIDPLLDIEATRVIQGIEAIVQVRGTMRQPEVSFRSNPPLEQADVLSLIIFNQPANQLGEGQQASLAQRAGDLAAGYLASGLARSIGNALNLNEFEIQAQGENGEGPSVTLGQQIGQDLYVKLQQGFGNASTTQMILEYQIEPFLRLRATSAEASPGQQRIQFRRVERGGVDLIFFFAY